jgi:hypothetical protein
MILQRYFTMVSQLWCISAVFLEQLLLTVGGENSKLF